MRFAEFLIYDEAADAIYDDPNGQRKCRACLTKLAEMARRHPGLFSEAAKRDSRKGVAFKQKALDDVETGVFAQRLADRLWRTPDEPQKGKMAKKPEPSPTGTPAYGDFLRQSVQRQGDVLGDMQWEQWQVTKAAMELGGIDPVVLADPKKSPAERLALTKKINWGNVTLPALKAKLGASFAVPADWKRAFGIMRLKKIRAAVEHGQPITDPHDQKLLHIWRTLEVQLGGEGERPSHILPAGPHTDVGVTRLPMSPADRKRFYQTLTGTHESVDPARPLQLSPQSAYDYLTRYGAEILTDEQAKDLFLTRILQDLHDKTAFIPSSQQGTEADKKRWRDAAGRSWGGFLPPARYFDPATAPGVAQRLSGMTTRGFRTRTNPSGRRVPYAYNEPEEFEWPAGSEDMPGIKYSIDAPSQEVADEDVNAFYRSRSTEANAAVRQELEKPARDAVMWLKKQGWISDSTKAEDYVQQVVMGMLARTGSVKDWRNNVGFRRATAMMLARRYVSQGWPSGNKERTGHMGLGDEDQPGTLQSATGSGRSGGEDDFTRMRGGAAKARQVIQRAIAAVLNIDTSVMGGDEAAFVDSIDSLGDPQEAVKALTTLDRISARHAATLPQVRKAVDRIKHHLDPLLGLVRGVA